MDSTQSEYHTASEAGSLAFRAAPAVLAGLLDVLILEDLLRFDRHVHNVGRVDVELALLERGFVVEHAAEEDESNVGRRGGPGFPFWETLARSTTARGESSYLHANPAR